VRLSISVFFCSISIFHLTNIASFANTPSPLATSTPASTVSTVSTAPNIKEQSEPVIKVGVVQRFGEKVTDQITLKAPPGQKLNLKFKTMEGAKTLVTDQVVIKVQMESLKTPTLRERLVLSSHRSYETAEESANKWREAGIAVEIAQPSRWKVWAKRDVYKTPLLRRWLKDSLTAQGHENIYLDVEAIKQSVVAYWQINGQTYRRHELDITSSNNIIIVNTGKEGKDQHSYGGSLRLQPNAYATYTLVNLVPLETYLRGVVPHELGAWQPQAAIESQAILARTYALRNLRRFQADDYQLCADPHCQVYKGLDVYPETDRAVANTKNLVLTYENQLVDAVYYSMSGGVTADFNDLWDGSPRPYLKPVVDSAQNIWDLSTGSLADEQNFRKFMAIPKGFNEDGWLDFRWSEELSLQGIANVLISYFREKNSPLAKLKKVTSLEVTERSPAGRVLKMIAQTDVGTIELKKDEIQNALWFPLSTLFYLDPIYDQKKILKGYRIVGGGFGHGVGFSQTGCVKLGELGWTSDRILNFYFSGTKIQPLTPDMISDSK